MENALVNLLICGCLLFTKASHFYNCSGCQPKRNGTRNGNVNRYKCDACDRIFDHSVNEKDCSSGNIAASVVGGALFGSLVTVLIFMLHRYRQKKSIRNPVQNPSYQTEMMRINERGLEEDIGKSMYSEINDERSNKESRVPPIWKNGNIHENKDGVYNTLNEANIMDRSEYYDHTRPGASFSTPADGYGTVTLEYDQARIDASVSKPSDGYGTVTLENGGNDTHPKDKSVVEKDIISSQEDKTDEYFVLEKIQ
ncbi:uncharacterized protein LOC134250550 isoform X2 [Saccostrea cucullata]|uniref:uncharacterized protein LOC134250550 isoform X2 n=1 Tax=Saccostrea cuccullata TaxID=36930 RepID=UPI002ED1ABAA